MRIGPIQDTGPLLTPDIEDGTELARNARDSRTVLELSQPAGHRIEGGRVDGVHLTGKRGQLIVGVGGEPRCERGRDGQEELLERSGTVAGEPVVDGLIADREPRILPQSGLGQQAPQVGLAGPALQDADEQPTPRHGCWQEWGTTARRRPDPAVARQGPNELAQQPLDFAHTGEWQGGRRRSWAAFVGRGQRGQDHGTTSCGVRLVASVQPTTGSTMGQDYVLVVLMIGDSPGQSDRRSANLYGN